MTATKTGTKPFARFILPQGAVPRRLTINQVIALRPYCVCAKAQVDVFVAFLHWKRPPTGSPSTLPVSADTESLCSLAECVGFAIRIRRC